MRTIYKRGASYGLILLALVMISINIFSYIIQISIDNYALENNIPTQNIPNGGNTFTRSYAQSNSSATNPVLNNDIKDQLPSSSGGFVSSIGTFFFPIVIFLNWVSSAGTFILGFITAVPTLINGLGLPAPISFALGVFWFTFSIFALIIGILK